MKMLKRLSFMLFAASALLVGCNNNDPDTPGGGGEGGDTRLTLSVDKASIMANGSDRATFTVVYVNDNGVTIDVTTDAVISGEGAEVDGYQFSTATAGEYNFTATYTDPNTGTAYTSNTVTVTASSLVLEVDNEIISNAGGVATFTVTYEGTDVTESSVINNLTLGTSGEPADNTFTSPGYVGEFQFTATYRNITSNTVTVTVEAGEATGLRLIADKQYVSAGEQVNFTVMDLETGTDVTAEATITNGAGETVSNPYTATAEIVEFTASYNDKVSQTLEVGNGSFHKNVTVVKFTSTKCPYCVMQANALEGAKENKPNSIVEIAVHHPGMGSDPMIPDNVDEFSSYYGITNSLPITFYDNVSMQIGAGSTNDALGYINPLINNNPYVGISGESTVNGRSIEITANVQATTAGDYYLTVMLLESGIIYEQAGYNGGNYVHNHALRETLSEVISGDALGSLSAGQEVTKTYTLEADSEYNLENCSVVCYVSTHSGQSWTINNAIEFPLGSWADYSFKQL